MTYTAPAPVIEHVAPAYAVYAATATVNEYAASAHFICHQGRRSRSVVVGSSERGLAIWSTRTELFGDGLRWLQKEYEAIHWYLGELETPCIATPETYADWKVCREDEIAGLAEALFLLSKGDVFPAMAYHRIPALTHLRLHLR